jgi:hypothetical protein
VAAAVVAALVGCCAWVVGYVDPFDSRVFSQRLDHERPAFFHPRNTALWAAFETERDKAGPMAAAEVVILGDSRAESLTGGWNMSRSADVRGSRIYNLAFGGASLYEQLDFFEHYELRFERAHTLIFSVPYSSFRPRAQLINDRARRALRDAVNPLYYLTDLAHFQTSLPVLFGASGGGALEYVERSRPQTLPIEAPLCVGGWHPTTKELAVGMPEHDAVHAAIARDILVTHLGPVLERLARRGVDVILLVPPAPPALERARHRRALAAFARTLEAFGRVFRPSEAFVKRVGWADRYHLCYEASMQILDMVLHRAGDQHGSADATAR